MVFRYIFTELVVLSVEILSWNIKLMELIESIEFIIFKKSKRRNLFLLFNIIDDFVMSCVFLPDFL